MVLNVKGQGYMNIQIFSIRFSCRFVEFSFLIFNDTTIKTKVVSSLFISSITMVLYPKESNLI